MAGIRIGLTGGIGSGKSTVAATWVALGATLVDTDAIAHALCAQMQVECTLVERESVRTPAPGRIGRAMA